MTGDVPPDPTLALEKQRARDEADAAERANAVDERVELPPDTIAPMPEWMYPRRLDSIPALFGRLNPLTGVLVYYTGAVLRECAGQPAVALQWMLFVFFPSCAALSFARKFWYESAYNREKKERGSAANRRRRRGWSLTASNARRGSTCTSDTPSSPPRARPGARAPAGGSCSRPFSCWRGFHARRLGF